MLRLTESIRGAGFVTLGRTNTPELGGTITTEPEAFGPSRNPWNTDRTPGGSSGGTAAAVSAGAAVFWFLAVMRIWAHFTENRSVALMAAFCAVLVGGTAYTVWSQSNVNEKVYTVSLLFVAVISYLAMLWEDHSDTWRGDRILVLVLFLLGIGWANHQMSVLPILALIAFILNWKYNRYLIPLYLPLTILLFDLAPEYALGLVIIASSMLLLAYSFHSATYGPGGELINMNAGLVLIGILSFVAGFGISLGPVMWVLFSELFPNRLRGIAISFCGLINSSISFLVQLVFPWELENFGPATTFLIYGSFAIVGLLFVMRVLPETKGRSLEELETELGTRA